MSLDVFWCPLRHFLMECAENRILGIGRDHSVICAKKISFAVVEVPASSQWSSSSPWASQLLRGFSVLRSSQPLVSKVLFSTNISNASKYFEIFSNISNNYFQIFPTCVDVLTSSSFVEALVSCAARPWWWRCRPMCGFPWFPGWTGPADRARSAWCCCWTWHCAAAQFTISYNRWWWWVHHGWTPLWHWVGRKPTGWICFMTLPFFMGKEVRKSDGFR